jgi:glycerol-3-phosphate dehydrogenase (NAD(P)+)
MNLCFYGAGAWGTALSSVAALHHDVVLVARDAKQASALARDRENRRYLPGIALSPLLNIEDRLERVAGRLDLLVIATPLAGLRDACNAARLHSDTPIVWLCKGIEEGSGLLPHEVVAEVYPNARAAVLSGPSFALEVARGQPTALTAASTDAALVDDIVRAFHSGALRVYGSRDLVGVEVGGAVKNVLAIAAGICDGLALGLNARAALITRGLSEMARFGAALGADADTLMGLSGVGDLILTCTGALSRNRRVGLLLGEGRPLADILASLGHVAEGVRCAESLAARAALLSVEMPITEAVCAILFKGQSAKDAVAGLLARAPRQELAL